MRDFDTTHLMFLTITLAFWVLSSYAVSKMSRKWQNVMFAIGAIMAAGGIFFRYGMGLSFDGGFTFQTLAMQMMQVCNFNLILVLLMLVPRFELARQYSVFFSMFAAFTTLVSIPNVWENYHFLDLQVLNSWLNHVFDIALPMWMIAARRLKPRREYVWKVGACVFGYFTVVAAISTLLIHLGVMTAAHSYSFIFTTDGIGIFELLRSWIPLPYFYLYPIFPLMIGFFYLWAWVFRKYEVEPFALGKG